MQTLNHLFLDCIEIKNFWFRIEDHIKLIYGQTCTLTDKEKIFGIKKLIPSRKEINDILLTAKYFIHVCRVTAKPLNFNHFLN